MSYLHIQNLYKARDILLCIVAPFEIDVKPTVAAAVTVKGGK